MRLLVHNLVSKCKYIYIYVKLTNPKLKMYK